MQTRLMLTTDFSSSHNLQMGIFSPSLATMNQDEYLPGWTFTRCVEWLQERSQHTEAHISSAAAGIC